jgi:hypothetical protein
LGQAIAADPTAWASVLSDSKGRADIDEVLQEMLEDSPASSTESE